MKKYLILAMAALLIFATACTETQPVPTDNEVDESLIEEVAEIADEIPYDY